MSKSSPKKRSPKVRRVKAWVWVHKVDGSIALENIVTCSQMIYLEKKDAVVAGKHSMTNVAWELAPCTISYQLPTKK